MNVFVPQSQIHKFLFVYMKNCSSEFQYIFLIAFFPSANWVAGQSIETSNKLPSTQQSGDSHTQEMPVLFKDNFEDGSSKWEVIDNQSWKLEDHGKGQSLSIIQRNSEYQPKVRSPRHIALIKDLEAADFVIKFKVKSTKDTGNHRDCCVFFGSRSYVKTLVS